jgi:hypothetical protein
MSNANFEGKERKEKEKKKFRPNPTHFAYKKEE